MKRRDFLKHAAIGGALGSLAGRVNPGGLVYPAYESSAAAGTKLVFVSDLHLNADADVSWIDSHLSDLAGFFSSIGERSDVSELVILGDLVDDWVIPTDRTPRSFDAILGADQNAAVVEALQAVCKTAIHVTYVTGNHDLLSFQQENTTTLNAFFPEMTVVSNEPGLGAYARDGVLYAEHGHRYDLFNSPDIWSHPGSHLPLGYFIARSVATRSAREGQIYTLPDTLRSWVSAVLSTPDLARSAEGLSALDSASDERIREILRDLQGPASRAPARRPAKRQDYPSDRWDDGFIDDDLVVLIFRIIALWAGEGPWSRFAMADEDGFASDPRVRDVAQWYDEIFSQWPDRQNIVSADMAFWNDLDYMGSAADLLFAMPERIKPYYDFTPRIVLFGHTHKAVLQFHGGADTIYANTGTWIDSKPMTWVEVEVPAEGAVDERKYTVSLWYLGDDKARYSASIDAPAA
jgi:UDP-2,3-diacylglucosamine pyrophosphatase LpxH